MSAANVAVWGVVGAAMGAYDGYKYAKKKKLKGVKKAAAIVGGALLGAVNPGKVAKAATKAVKYTKKAVKAAKAKKAAKKASKTAKTTKAKVKKTTTTAKKDTTSSKKTKTTTAVAKKASTSTAKKQTSTNSNKYDYDTLAKRATQNAYSTEVVLGKLNENGISYVEVAVERRATYFQLDEWDEVEKCIGSENMWNINRSFLEQQIDAGKTFYTSHNPKTATGFFKQEMDYMNSRGFDFIPDGVLWRGVKRSEGR